MPKDFYSCYRSPRLLKQATLKLLEGNIDVLLPYMYDPDNQQGVFGLPEVRIGLSIKLLHNLRGQFDEKLLKPVLEDIEELLQNEEYLESTSNPELRKRCLLEEYHFVQKFLELDDDNITLNTEYKPERKKDPKTISSNQSEFQSVWGEGGEESGCILM